MLALSLLMIRKFYLGLSTLQQMDESAQETGTQVYSLEFRLLTGLFCPLPTKEMLEETSFAEKHAGWVKKRFLTTSDGPCADPVCHVPDGPCADPVCHTVHDMARMVLL